MNKSYGLSRQIIKISTLLLGLIWTFLIIYPAPHAWAVTAKQLWRADGQANLEGRWLFYVGPQKLRYRVFLKQYRGSTSDSYIVTGYMLSPRGERFDFHEGSMNHGQGRTALFGLELHEGESIWYCTLQLERPGYWWSGEVRHYQTNKLQAKFQAQKL